MNKRIAVALAAAMVSCGGGAWVDPTSGNFNTQDSAEVMSLVSTALSAAVQVQPNQPVALGKALVMPRSNDVTQSVNYSASCTPSGSVAITGSMDASCNASQQCSFNGGMQLKLSSCTNDAGLMADGQINIGANGSSSSTSFSLHETVQGGITVTRNGVTIGTCGINVTIDIAETSTSSTVTYSGTVCKQAVQQ
jgi:hypothetical protein